MRVYLHSCMYISSRCTPFFSLPLIVLLLVLSIVVLLRVRGVTGRDFLADSVIHRCSIHPVDYLFVPDSLPMLFVSVSAFFSLSRLGPRNHLSRPCQ